MRPTIALACALMGLGLSAARTTGALGDALVVEDNPVGPVYTATLLDKATTGLRGSITGTAANDGVGVIFNVDFFGFPDERTGGPFIYHIHDQPVPADGNCTRTLAHLDPFIRGENPPCDATDPASCQVGDLNGKHGNITNVDGGKHFVAKYLDLYASTKPGIGAFFGNRSIVVHFANKTRINCGNFIKASCASSSTEPATTARSATILPSAAVSATGLMPTGANVSQPTLTLPSVQGIATRISVFSVFGGIALVVVATFML